MKKKGFSFLETIVAIAIGSVVLLAILGAQRNVFTFTELFSEAFGAQGQARRAMREFASEVRTASQSNNGTFAIASAATSSFVFYADIDHDALKEKIRYYKDGIILKKGVIKPTTSTPAVYNSASEKITTIATDLIATTTPIFTYYNTNYDGTASSSALSYPLDTQNIRLVKIIIWIKPTNGDKQSLPIIFTTQVSIRNLKDNL